MKIYRRRETFIPGQVQFSSLVGIVFLFFYLSVGVLPVKSQTLLGTPTLVPSKSTELTKQDFVQDEMLIEFNSGVSDSEKKKVISRFGVGKPLRNKPDIYQVKINNGLPVSVAIEICGKILSVNYAQPDYIYRNCLGPRFANKMISTPTATSLNK